MIDNFFRVSSNLKKEWELKDSLNKQKFQNLIFPDGVVYVVENDQYRTKTVNDLIKLSHSFTDHFENKKTGIIKNLSDYAGSVPRAGLEPACPCEHRCLRPARLPIPPPGQLKSLQSYSFLLLQTNWTRTIKPYI